MFAALLGYRDLSFWQEHRYIQFDTLTQEGRYEVLQHTRSRVALTDGGVEFPYYTYSDLRIRRYLTITFPMWKPLLFTIPALQQSRAMIC